MRHIDKDFSTRRPTTTSPPATSSPGPASSPTRAVTPAPRTAKTTEGTNSNCCRRIRQGRINCHRLRPVSANSFFRRRTEIDRARRGTPTPSSRGSLSTSQQGNQSLERSGGPASRQWSSSRHSTPSKQNPAPSGAGSGSSGLTGSASGTGLSSGASGVTSGGTASEIGRTSEQGRDYLIELDGDLLSVYGLQSLKFLDRPWNK